ncbi:MAG TPA: hypothetical protein VMZ03_10255 [Chitinophagaceae bacterium]|nr:hypothetical protein [Chitinophagaceae bacterium]
MKRLLTIFFSLNCAFYCLAQPASENLALTEARYIPMEKTIFYELGDKTIPIKVIQYGAGSNTLCINIHDNEFTSVQAAKAVLELKGGTLIKIENNAQRIIRFRLQGMLYSFDPNRIFSREGIEQSLKENGRTGPAAIDEVEKFGERLLQLIPDSISCVIALHNNTEEAYSIKSYLPGGDRRSDAKDVYADKAQDVDDIVFTTDEWLFKKMSTLGYNSILQDNQRVKRDGSLSVYYGERGRRYVNIETQHGKTGQYQQMLDKLIEILSFQKQPA